MAAICDTARLSAGEVARVKQPPELQLYARAKLCGGSLRGIVFRLPFNNGKLSGWVAMAGQAV